MSLLNQHFERMVKSVRNRGFKLGYLEETLPDLDRFYDERFPSLETITFDSAKEWVFSPEADSLRKQTTRKQTLKYLSEYLTSIGIESYTPDFRIGKDWPKPPQLLTDRHLKLFFDAADAMTPYRRALHRELIAPVLFRLILCCGLRNSEAGMLEKENIDLEQGTIRVLHSKGDKDRIVYMDDSLVQLCIRFDSAYSAVVKDRKYFFQISEERPFPTKHNIDDWFDRIMEEAGFLSEFPNKPTVHGLRHLFAVKSMKKCLAEGESFGNWIKYLSKYMGHESSAETMYYLHMVESLLPEFLGKVSPITEGLETIHEEY